MTSTARQLRQPPTIEAIKRVLYFADEPTKKFNWKNAGPYKVKKVISPYTY